VVIYRTEKNLSFGGRSFCPKCKKQLLWYDNIPLISFLILRGKCRFCQKKISAKYPITEAVSGIIFLFAAYLVFNDLLNNFFNHFFAVSGFVTLLSQKFNLTSEIENWNFYLKIFELIFLVTILSTLFAVFLYDLKHLLIPDSYSIFGIIIAFVFNLYSDIFLFVAVLAKNNHGIISEVINFSERKIHGFLPIDVSSFAGFLTENFRGKMVHLKALFSSADSFIASKGTSLIEGADHPYFSLFLAGRVWSGLLAGTVLAGFFFLLVYISKETWMGKGDIKLAFLMGLFLGTTKTFIAASLAFEIGAVFGITLILLSRAKMKTALPFGPFLIIGTILSLLIT